MIKKSGLLILLMIVCAVFMAFVDGVLQPSYWIKSGIKVIVFLGIPLLYFGFNSAERKNLKQLWIFRKQELKVAACLAIFVYLVVLGAYFLFRGWIDFSGIKDSLTSGAGVNQHNFVFVAIYISIVNSLLEEFFFRGFSFLVLKEKTGRVFAYCFSSSLFAFYHVGMLQGWFNPIIYGLAMLGLFLGGCIFSFLNETSNSIYPSWLVHMSANLAINTVGFLLFGLIG